MANQENLYWADQIADRIIKERKKKEFDIASGISPSGSIHIGNLREEMTVDLVKRALESKKVKVNYRHSWDNFDRFRKVPANAPQEWEKYIGMSLSAVPDPWKCHKSYGEHFEKEFEEGISIIGVNPEYQNQTELYEKCTYAKEIKNAMNKREKIKEVLSKFRKEPIEGEWYPIQIYCEKCGKDTTKVTDYDEEYTVNYECTCGNKNKVNFSKKGIVKLRWKTDWAMRWNFYEVDFEPGGKDHSTPGGSRDASKWISKDVYNYQAPIYQMYNFIGIKGQGGKISGSKGNAPILKDLLDVYIPEIVRFLYAGTRPKTEFAIPIGDEEVFKVYEDFYYAERVYYGKEKLDGKKEAHLKRVYEMSVIDKPSKTMQLQLPFKYLVMLSQFYKKNTDVIKKLVESEHIKKTEAKDTRINTIIDCARTWSQKHAPEDYVYTIQDTKMGDITTEEKDALRIFIEKINQNFEENDLYKIGKDSGLGGNFFKLCYKLLLNKERGPRLYELVQIIGPKKVEEILSKYL